ncbi:MAG: hypothetical protein ACPG5U_08860, partial [Planktomarina sp.]
MSATSAFAQTADAESPLSAIDWLQNTPQERPVTGSIEPSVAGAASAVQVDVSALPTTRLARMGLIPAAPLGFDDDFWANVSATEFARALADLPEAQLPSMADLRHKMLLADLPATDDIQAARLQGLWDTGAVDAMWVLGKSVADQSERLMTLTRDAAIITEHEQAFCSIWSDHRTLDPSPLTRSICLASLGDWNAAVMTYFAHDTFGDFSAADSALISGHLDPELADGAPAPDLALSDMTATRFFLMESVGHPVATGDLPLAYAAADLRKTGGWKPRIEAAERLTRAGSLTPNQLLGVYTEDVPAASGGIWDRARAVQNLRDSQDANEVTPEHLSHLWSVMTPAGLASATAKKFAETLHEMDAIPSDNPDLIQLGLLAGFGDLQLANLDTDIRLRLWRSDVTLGTRLTRQAIAAGLTVKVTPTAAT